MNDETITIVFCTENKTLCTATCYREVNNSVVKSKVSNVVTLMGI